MPALEPASAADVAVLEQQLGRPPRGIAGIAWRCPCGKPGVVATEPRLAEARLALVTVTAHVIRHSLGILGVSAPEHM